jgi:hypothetical protein
LAALPGESSKRKTPARFAPAGVLEFRSFSVSTYLLRALVGVLGTSTTRTTGTTPTVMTSATAAIARAMNNPKACASKKGMVVKSKSSERVVIRNECGKKHNPFRIKAIGYQQPSFQIPGRKARRPSSGQCARSQCSCGFQGILFQDIKSGKSESQGRFKQLITLLQHF